MPTQPEDLIRQAAQARKAGRLHEAAELYTQAAELYRAAGHELRLAHTLRHAADVLRDDGKLAQAEPLYLEATQNQLPTLVRVIVAYENRIVMAETLPQALAAIFKPAVAAPSR